MWRKDLDRSSPRLWQAPVSDENRTTLELRFGAAPIASSTGTGVEVRNHTLRPHSAITHFAIPNNRNPEPARYADFEDLSFTCRQIEWI